MQHSDRLAERVLYYACIFLFWIILVHAVWATAGFVLGAYILGKLCKNNICFAVTDLNLEELLRLVSFIDSGILIRSKLPATTFFECGSPLANNCSWVDFVGVCLPTCTF
jgi:hypothetical protein